MSLHRSFAFSSSNAAPQSRRAATALNPRSATASSLVRNSSSESVILLPVEDVKGFHIFFSSAYLSATIPHLPQTTNPAEFAEKNVN